MKTVPVIIVLVLVLVAGAAGYLTLSRDIGHNTARVTELGGSVPEEQSTVSPAQVTLEGPASTETPDDLDKIISEKVSAAVDAALVEKQDEIDTAVARAVEREVDIMTEAFSQTMAAETVAEEERRDKEREERSARQQQRMEEWRKNREKSEIERMSTELALREDQKQRVSEILATHNDAMRDGMQKMRTGELSVPDFIQGLRKENNDAMREVLDEEQFAAYQESQQKRYGWIFNLMGGGRAGSRNTAAPAPAQ